MADNREYSAEIARLRAVSKEALEQAKQLELERDVRYAVYWDGDRASFGGTCPWEELPHDDRKRIRAGIDALDQFDRAAAACAAVRERDNTIARVRDIVESVHQSDDLDADGYQVAGLIRAALDPQETP